MYSALESVDISLFLGWGQSDEAIESRVRINVYDVSVLWSVSGTRAHPPHLCKKH